MAEIARGPGVEVEIAAFEGWDAAGRTFDRVTSAQPGTGSTAYRHREAASVLRPGAAWSDLERGLSADDLAELFEEVYGVSCRRSSRLFRGYAANRSSAEDRPRLGDRRRVSAVPDFGAPTERWFPGRGSTSG